MVQKSEALGQMPGAFCWLLHPWHPGKFAGKFVTGMGMVRLRRPALVL
jgi:hypothetical protein